MSIERRVEDVNAKVAELVAIGASEARRDRDDDPDDPVFHVVMQDPGGNESCVS